MSAKATSKNSRGAEYRRVSFHKVQTYGAIVKAGVYTFPMLRTLKLGFLRFTQLIHHKCIAYCNNNVRRAPMMILESSALSVFRTLSRLEGENVEMQTFTPSIPEDTCLMLC